MKNKTNRTDVRIVCRIVTIARGLLIVNKNIYIILSEKYTKSINIATDTMIALTTQEEVENFVKQNSLAVLFKAGSCRQTENAMHRLTAFFKKHSDVPVGTIDVVLHRTASNTATGLSWKKHESPQVLVFKDGKCIFEANHWRIETITLIDALEPHLEVRKV
jgi:bacillithiol system protein YtxJ